MRSVIAFSCLLASITAAAPASAAECPGNPNALGTSRTIVVDPRQHQLLGSLQYAESLPLNDKEVVITFDDGPLPPYSTRILDILARECVKATFFLVGRMARAYPKVVRRMDDEGHTLANHSQNHPFNFHTMSVSDAAEEIEAGFASIAAAVGDPAKVAPFFRFPGLHRQDAVERYLASHGRMSWSVDFMADDWTRITASEIVERAISRLDAKGKGILLLHDIKPATALGLQNLLDELKARGYKVVHVVPASASRPATATSPEQWVARHPRPQLAQRGPNIWPPKVPYRVRHQVAFETPSLASFGGNGLRNSIPLSLAAGPEMLRNDDGGVALPVWPDEVNVSAVPDATLLPVPAADHFRYISAPHRRTKRDKRRSRPTPSAVGARPDLDKARATTGTRASGSEPKLRKSQKSQTAGQPGPKRPTGHQIQLSKPQASLDPRR